MPNPKDNKETEEGDEILRRMLKTPPPPKEGEKEGKKPEQKPKKEKPTK